MKAKFITFVRGLMNGTPPRFQSYLKSLTILLGLVVSVNVWGELKSLAPEDGKSYVIVATSGSGTSMKYYALPQITTATTYSGTEVVVNASGYVTTKDAPTWTLEKGSTAGQFYLKYSNGTSTYYLYKNGTSSSNYNIKGSTTSDKNYWAFATKDNGYTINSVNRGTSNTYLSYYSSKFQARTATTLYLLELAPSYKITATSNNTTYGTVELSGDVITASPKSGYTYANPAYTVTSGSAEVEQDGDKFTVKTTADCTVRINFAVKQAATIKLSEAGVITDGPSGKYSGESYTLPTTCNQPCGDKTFVGWSTETVDSPTKPTSKFYEPGEEVTLAAENIFYAVFADGSAGGGVGPTITKSVSLSSTNWSNDTKYTSLTIETGIITATASDGTNNGKFYTNDNSWRFYANESGTLTIATTSGYELEGIAITYSVKDNGTLSYNSSSVTSGTNIVVSGQSATFAAGSSSGSKGKVFITAISVKYHSTAGGTSYSNYTTTCRSLIKIEVSTEPKKIYTVGDNFDPTGLVIKATYDSGDPDYIAYSDNGSNFTFNPSLSTELAASNTSVTIGYGGLTCTQDISVSAKPALSSITLSGTYQTNFIKSETFNSNGLVVTAHYGAIEEDVTSQAEISGYDKSVLGKQTITVSFTDGNTQSATYYVNVWELSASSSNTDLGTVGRSAYVITGKPKEGVTYADPAYTVDGSADVVQGTDANINKFTVSNVTANTTVTINFVEKAKDTYIDQLHSQLTTDNVFYDSYNAPNISYSHTTTGDNCQDEHIYFAGWTSTQSQTGSSTAPVDMFAAGTAKTAGGNTYYAVWAAGEVSTFDASNTSNLSKGSGNVWTENTTGVKLTISDGQLYTSGSPKTFTVTKGTSNNFQISHTSKKIDNLEVTISESKYKINSVTKGTLTTSSTTQYVKGINATSVQCKATSDNQIRATLIKAICLSDYLTACCTPLSAPASITIDEQTPNSLSFSWAEVANASGYEYKLSTADAWTSTTETSATIEGLAAATEYTIQVRATDNTGNYCESGNIKEQQTKTYYKTEIYISTPPKIDYVEGDLFDKEEMVVWYTHEDKKESVSDKVTWSPSGALTTDVTEITVSYKVSDDVTLTTTQAITVKAKWTVHYSINGNVTDETCAKGEAADVPEVIAKDGFTFTGWVTEAMAAETPTKPTYALQQTQKKYTPEQNNEIFYAVFERKEVTACIGSVLSVDINETPYYVGTYNSGYYSGTTKIEDATVFFFDETSNIYYYDSDKKYYLTLDGGTSTTADRNETAPNNISILPVANTSQITIANVNNTDTRKFARNSQNGRFANYKGNDYAYNFNKTDRKVEVNQSYYNTSAVVPSVHHIEVKNAPTTTYYEGDKFDATGLVVWAYYSADDQIGKEVPASQYTLQIGTETDLTNYELKATDENVVITFRNAQCPQSITVNAITLTSINVTTGPNQTKYTPGAAFNPAGMVVYAVYNDIRKNKNVPLKEGDADGYTFSPATLTELGEQDVTISYTDGTRGTQTTTTKVTVNSALNEIRVKTNPDKMTYVEDELFDKTGMVVEGSYGESAEWKDITGWTYEPTTAIVAKGTLTADEQRDITIKYNESGVDKTTTLKVTVQPYPRYTVTFSVNGNTDLQLTETDPEGGITIPANPANIGDYTFVGWAEATMAAESPEKPAMIAEAVGATYYITANKTLYAVYSMEKEGDLQGYTMSMEVNTETKTISYFSGDEFYAVSTGHDPLILYFSEGLMFYMDGSTPNYVYMTSVSDAKLTKSTTKNIAANYKWIETKANNTYSYYRSEGYNTRYLAWNGSYWRAYGTTTTTNNSFTKIASGSPIKYVMPHYTTSPETAKTPVVKFNTSTASTPVLTDAADHTSLATYVNNTLSSENTKGTVVYTLADGDDAVATIAADGTVTAKKAGSVTVTATVGAVAGEWKEASASYTLTFTKIAPTIAFDDNQPTEVYVGNVVTVHATSNSDAEVKYSATSEKISVNATTGEVTGVGTTTSTVKVTATVEATDLYTKTSTTTDIKVKSNAKTQTLTFAKPEGYDFAPNATVEPFTNTLSGAKTTVTYSLKEGSTADLVTLNATTGEVSVNTNLSGSAIVVATAEAGNVTEEGIIWAYGKATAEYAINVSYFRPIMTFTPGLVNQDEQWRGKQTVTFTAQEGDKIYYTLDGEDPTTSSTQYEAEFEISDADADNEGNLTIKAIAVSNDGAMTSPVLSKTLTVAVPTMTAKAKDVDVTDDSEIELDANDVVTLNATACKIDYHILNASGTELEKKVGNATTELTFSKGGTFTLEATPRWNVTNGFSGKKQTWIVTVKGAGHLPINYNGNSTGLADLSYFTKDGDFGNYDASNNEKTQIKIEGGTLTVSFLEEPTTLSYHLMLNGTANDGNSVVVQQSADGHSWTTIVTHCTANSNLLTTNPSKQEGARDPYQFNLNSTTRYVRWTYNKESGNVGLGSIYIGTNSLIVDNDQNLDPDFRGNVIVENGGKLTVVDLSEITDLTIEPGGVVDAHTYTNAALTVNNLYLQSADHKSGQFLIDNDDIDIESKAYFDLTLNAAPRTWYDFAVPFKVNRNSISLANGGAMPEYDIMQYNGATRATNGANKSAWEYVDEGDLNPGTFYMIMFASNVETIRFTKNDGAVLNNAGEVVEVNDHESSNPLDANWNGIANNTLQYVNLGFTEDGNANIKAQVYHPGDKNYTTYKQDEVTFVVGAPFFVQVATYDFVDWSYPTIYNEVLRAPSNVTESVGEFTLELMANGVTYDRLFVSASEDATDSYQIGHDLAKMGVSTTVAQMWINNYNTKLCANEAVLINGQATYQMEVFVPEEGEYKIAITNAPENATLYLTIDGQVAWNLSESAYVANLTKGTHNEFGLLLIADERTTPTNINGLNGNIKAQKIFKDYNIYILRDTKLYNAQGVKVQ